MYFKELWMMPDPVRRKDDNFEDDLERETRSENKESLGKY